MTESSDQIPASARRTAQPSLGWTTAAWAAGVYLVNFAASLTLSWLLRFTGYRMDQVTIQGVMLMDLLLYAGIWGSGAAIAYFRYRSIQISISLIVIAFLMRLIPFALFLPRYSLPFVAAFILVSAIAMKRLRSREIQAGSRADVPESGEPATDRGSAQEPGLGLAVGIHFMIGLLLVSLDPLFGESIWPGVEAAFRLLPYIGLFWMLVAAVLISRQQAVIQGAIAVHYSALLLPVLGCGLSGFLLLNSEPRGHMPGAGLAVGFGIILVFISAIFVGVSAACIFSLRQLLKQTTPPRPLWSKWTLTFSALALICFALNIANTESRNRTNARRSAEIEQTVAHDGDVVSIVFSPDSALLATAALTYDDSWIRIWDVTSGQMIRQLQVTRNVSDLVWSKDEKWLVAGCGENHDHYANSTGAALVWDTSNWELVHKFEFETGHLSAVAMSPDSEFLAVATKTEQRSSIDVMVYKTENQDVVGFGRVFNTPRGRPEIATLFFTPDNQRLIAAGSVGLAVWKLPIERERKSPEIIGAPGPHPDSPAISSMVTDGTELVCVSHGRLLRYAVSDMHSLPEIPYYEGSNVLGRVSIDMSEENQIVLGYRQVVQYLSWPDGNVLCSITPESDVSALAISDNAAVVAIGTSRRVRLHDGHTGEFLRELIKP